MATLHNPRYAGAFCYGRSRTWKDVEGKKHTQRLRREQWRFLKQEAHPGYLSWDQFLANEKRLLENFQVAGGCAKPDRRAKAQRCSRDWYCAAGAVTR